MRRTRPPSESLERPYALQQKIGGGAGGSTVGGWDLAANKVT
jgi:hypothetical protein